MAKSPNQRKRRYSKIFYLKHEYLYAALSFQNKILRILDYNKCYYSKKNKSYYFIIILPILRGLTAYPPITEDQVLYLFNTFFN